MQQKSDGVAGFFAVQRFFLSRLHACWPKLLTSFDGTSFGLPHETTKIKPSTDKWFHTDQSYSRNDFEAIQSWVTGYDVNEGDATLGFLENSHLFHKQLKEEFKLNLIIGSKYVFSFIKCFNLLKSSELMFSISFKIF